MAKKKKIVSDVLEAMLEKDLEEFQEKKECTHFTKSIRLTRTLKYLSKKSFGSCKNCKSDASLWICLYCGNLGCGRYENQHAQLHYEKNRIHHCIAVAIVDDDLSFWCYQCDESLIPNPSKALLWDCRIKLGKVLKIADPEIKSALSSNKEIASQNSLVIPGIVNLGNTCFFNSVMQCFCHSFKLIQNLKDETLEMGENTLVYSFSKVLREMEIKILNLEKDSFDKVAGTPLNPKELFQRLSRKWKIYSQFRQQDSHELLLRLLDLMDSEFKLAMPSRVSFVKEVFGGVLASLIICDACESISTSKEDYVVLSLSIQVDNTVLENDDSDDLLNKLHGLNISKPSSNQLLKKITINRSGSAINLLTCLEKFMEVEILDGENKRLCDACSKKNKYSIDNNSQSVETESSQPALRKAFKRYLLYSTPPILIFHLKRFQLMGLFRTKKIDTFVEFDEYLETGPFLVPKLSSSDKDPENLRYRLYGIVVHSGSLSGGHYISYVRKHDSNSWFYCSDSHTRSATWDQVRKCQAYLLFYRLI